MKKPTISIIAGIGPNRELGKNNQLLWDIPEDLKHFREITSGHPVIMGERTFYSIGKPLPNRTNIVLTMDKNLKIDGCLMAHTPDEAIEIASKHDQGEIFVIGGGMVYKTFLPKADKLYLTLVEGTFDADVFFPEYEDIFNNMIKCEKHDNGQYKFQFVELTK